MRSIKIVVVAVVCAALFATSGEAATKNPYGDSKIDPPAAGSPILTVVKAGKSTAYTLAQLKALKPKVISIYEPFLKVRQSFTVIPLSTLFTASKITKSDSVQTIALNDYIYTNTAGNFLSAKGYLAIARNGKDIPYDQGGPVRIVFPDGSKWSKFLDPWNWSLVRLAVK